MTRRHKRECFTASFYADWFYRTVGYEKAKRMAGTVFSDKYFSRHVIARIESRRKLEMEKANGKAVANTEKRS